MVKIYNPPPSPEEILLRMAELTAYLMRVKIALDITGPGSDGLHFESDRREDWDKKNP